MGALSRNKGAAFEREIARELGLLLGIGFKRELEQVREAGFGDLTADDPAFPFLIECKRYASGTGPAQAWISQAERAAFKAGKFAAVVFRFDRQPVRVSVPMRAICTGAPDHERAEVTLTGLAYLAREIMASRWRETELTALHRQIIGEID